MELLNNYDVKNHKKQLMKMASSADEMVLASPFLGGDINALLEAINKKEQLKHIVLLTVLKAYDEGINKADTLTAFIEYCEIKNISYEIHIDEKLHGKVYLFYKKKQEKGIIISSSNFTSNGLVKNHEWGISFEDAVKQKEIRDKLINNNGNTIINKQDVELIKKAAEQFKEDYPTIKKEKPFDPTKVLNMKPTECSNDIRYFIKPVGSREEPYTKHEPIGNDLYFSKKRPSAVREDDILICYAVCNQQHMLGYYKVSSDSPLKVSDPENVRWPWYVNCECLSNSFSNNWWNYNLFMDEIKKEYHSLYPYAPLVHNGGTTLGGLQWGTDKIQLDKKFARFMIEAIDKVMDK